MEEVVSDVKNFDLKNRVEVAARIIDRLTKEEFDELLLQSAKIKKLAESSVGDLE